MLWVWRQQQRREGRGKKRGRRKEGAKDKGETEPLVIPDVNLRMDLVVSTFQEAFSFRQVWGMESASQTSAHAFSGWRESMLFAAGIATSVFLGFSKNPKYVWDCPSKLLQAGGDIIPFRSVVGGNGMSIGTSLVDSGLCILSTWDPLDSGFYAYKNYPLTKGSSRAKPHEEVFANKGLLWCYFNNDQAFKDRSTDSKPDQVYMEWHEHHLKLVLDKNPTHSDIGTLIITTHLTTHRKYKRLQLEEFITEFQKLKERFLAECNILEIYITGDYNLCYSDVDMVVTHESGETLQLLDYFQKKLGLTRVNRGKPTSAAMDRCLDHIWMWRGGGRGADADEQTLQDIIVLNDEPQKPWVLEKDGMCQREKGLLADHMWQGIVIRDATDEQQTLQ
ncbi:hypothetical protein RFI_19459 [Reticulomyxa filosa]|uniref:Endonuclease/exonuclease/phosphatase domain-containing protein n=1 Tax=Reticulomyxa filosa TaxID=46433 RepID=X6MW46_RETFI|nr:hypothetical protein RFI_19459 [Reticulomyxa filosa]|eukprot:ETO17851.1 hypothetical protein RFI_19459 [Reticulomyxa filosa]